MKHVYKIVVYLFLTLGYVFNMYYLTVDNDIRRYQWLNKVGVVIVPLGSVMGGVYALDEYNKCIKSKRK